jgi:hypothetical protein
MPGRRKGMAQIGPLKTLHVHILSATPKLRRKDWTWRIGMLFFVAVYTFVIFIVLRIIGDIWMH